MFPDLSTLLPILSILIALCVAVGSVMAFRGNTGKGLSEAQEKAITALTVQNQVQEKQITWLRKENIAMRAAFKHLGIAIEIDGDEVVLIDEQKPKRTRIMAVHIAEDVKNGVDKEA